MLHRRSPRPALAGLVLSLAACTVPREDARPGDDVGAADDVILLDHDRIIEPPPVLVGVAPVLPDPGGAPADEPVDEPVDEAPLPDGNPPADEEPTVGPPQDPVEPVEPVEPIDESEGCGGPGLAPGNHTVALQHDGVARSYRLHVPPGYDPDVAVPLVMNFHGLGGNPNGQAQNSGMNAKSNAEGFIVAYPAGLQNSWNAGTCCGQSAAQDVDDVGFVRAVVADVQQALCVDNRRVFATGFSNGGFLSHRLACEASDLFAAIAPVSSGLGGSCQPTRPVPVLHFHGTEDNLAAYELGVQAVESWVEDNDCTDDAPVETFRSESVHCETWSQCADGVEVTLCTVEGGGHCWPGNETCAFGEGTTEIDATDAIWDLFERFSLPP